MKELEGAFPYFYDEPNWVFAVFGFPMLFQHFAACQRCKMQSQYGKFQAPCLRRKFLADGVIQGNSLTLH